MPIGAVKAIKDLNILSYYKYKFPLKRLFITVKNLQVRITAGLISAMSDLACPLCTMDDISIFPTKYECMICGHEWAKEPLEEEEDAIKERIVKDAHGNVLETGDIVAMVKDLKLKGTSKVLKSGMKSKPIRLVDGDHEIDCKMDGLSIALKACFVKKVPLSS